MVDKDFSHVAGHPDGYLFLNPWIKTRDTLQIMYSCELLDETLGPLEALFWIDEELSSFMESFSDKQDVLFLAICGGLTICSFRHLSLSLMVTIK